MAKFARALGNMLIICADNTDIMLNIETRKKSIAILVIVLASALSSPMTWAFASSMPATMTATTRTVTGNHLDGSMICSNGIARNIELVFSGKKVNEQIAGNGTLFLYGYNPVSVHPLIITLNAGKLGPNGNYVLKGKMNEAFCTGLDTGRLTGISIYGRCGTGIVQSNVQTSDGAKAQLTGHVICSTLKQSRNVISSSSSVNTIIGQTIDGAVKCPNGSTAHTFVDINASQTNNTVDNMMMNGTVTLIEYPMFGGTVF